MLGEIFSVIAVFVVFSAALGAVIGVRMLRQMDAGTAQCGGIAASMAACDDVDTILPFWSPTGQRLVLRKR